MVCRATGWVMTPGFVLWLCPTTTTRRCALLLSFLLVRSFGFQIPEPDALEFRVRCNSVVRRVVVVVHSHPLVVVVVVVVIVDECHFGVVVPVVVDDKIVCDCGDGEGYLCRDRSSTG